MRSLCFAHRVLSGLVLLVLLLAFAPAKADTAKLAYAWPDGLAGTAKFSARKTRASQGREQVIVVRGSYGFSAQPTADGQLISFGKTEVDVQIDPPVSGMQGRLQQFLLSAANRRPSFVVDRQGKYLRLDGTDQYRRDLRQGYSQLVADLPDQIKQRVQETIEAAMSNQQLNARIAESWNRDVGAWAGAELDRGDTYEHEYENPVPMLGNTAIPMKTAYRYLGPVKCGPAAPGARCVHLEMRTFVNSDKVAKALEGFLKRMAGQGAGPFKIEQLKIDSMVRLVTEPGTLVPHRLEQQKVSEFVMTQGGQARASRQVEEMAYEFTYAAR